ASAQCFPRLARPLHEAVLMQLPALAESAPEQTLWICQYELIDVQNHAIKRKKNRLQRGGLCYPID
ncbi:hypothetical protein, partial [Escherichia coli]|uniref:hypothetical protein n=1 Tax=Escherichia coli TaxID=562 RepID=UPI00194F732B